MALPASGRISMSDVNVELGRSATTRISMGDADVRGLFGVASGRIRKSNGRGKSNAFTFTINSNQTNPNLRTLALAAGWDGASKVVATIGSGVYLGSNSTATPGLTINGSFPGGVELINNGFVIGMGGRGGNGGSSGNTDSTAGSAGGLALSVGVAIQITNNGTIAGGGGGGGGSNGGYSGGKFGTYYAGKGGGGGRSSHAANSYGGSGGGGGGLNGTVSAAGAGPAGSGGNWGSTGASSGKAGGAGGGAISGNSNITWVVEGTRLGAIA